MVSLRKPFIDIVYQDFLPNLKKHILPHIQNMHQEDAIKIWETMNDSESNSILQEEASRAFKELEAAAISADIPDFRDSVLFKGDRMYRHNLARFNYTTYDVRRASDVINPDTSHRNIMLLANADPKSHSNHPFLYARVLGIYHVNVIYTGKGRLDYTPRQVHFLWVWRFECQGTEWKDYRLDSVRFPPTAMPGVFGFVDPSDILRCSHIIPTFSKGKVHSDGVGLSHLARDHKDWSRYFVNR